MSSTQEVLDHHLGCFGRGDLDGILTDYSSTAVMFTAEAPLKGPAISGRSFRPSFRSLESQAPRSS